jgi:hypothetical protein
VPARCGSNGQDSKPQEVCHDLFYTVHFQITGQRSVSFTPIRVGRPCARTTAAAAPWPWPSEELSPSGHLQIEMNLRVVETSASRSRAHLPVVRTSRYPVHGWGADPWRPRTTVRNSSIISRFPSLAPRRVWPWAPDEAQGPIIAPQTAVCAWINGGGGDSLGSLLYPEPREIIGERMVAPSAESAGGCGFQRNPEHPCCVRCRARTISFHPTAPAAVNGGGRREEAVTWAPPSSDARTGRDGAREAKRGWRGGPACRRRVEVQWAARYDSLSGPKSAIQAQQQVLFFFFLFSIFFSPFSNPIWVQV